MQAINRDHINNLVASLMDMEKSMQIWYQDWRCWDQAILIFGQCFLVRKAVRRRVQGIMLAPGEILLNLPVSVKQQVIQQMWSKLTMCRCRWSSMRPGVVSVSIWFKRSGSGSSVETEVAPMEVVMGWNSWLSTPILFWEGLSGFEEWQEHLQ